MFKKVRRIVREWAEAAYNACFNRPVGYIYMFHMVCPKADMSDPIDELCVSPDFFETFLREHQKRLDFISINDLYARISNKQRSDKPFGIITFDDGYEDNFTYAYPILKNLNIPFVIYISAGLVNDHAPIWNYPLIIERIVKKNDELIIGGKKYVCQTQEQKNDTFLKLKGLSFSLPYAHLQEKFRQLFAEYLKDDIFPQNTLTWEQIEEMAKDPLCTIGSHTMSHCRLTITDNNSLQYELGESKRLLEQHIGKPVEHLSYPYGWKTDVSAEAITYAQQARYKTALRSFGGPIRKQDVDLFNLKRIQVNE
jgi:peptidoglycan/xylan/chitin deacetylase (PgdA/CDA1 family)